MSGPGVSGGGASRAATPAFSMVDLAAHVGLAAVPNIDRTCGWSLFYGADTKIRGLKTRLLYSGSGTDQWDLSVWLNGASTPAKRSALGITASGLYTVAFGTPLDVAALDDVVIGMRCTSAQRVVQAAALTNSPGATKFFAPSASPRLAQPFWAGPYTITDAALYSAGDARPSTDTFAVYGALFAIEPYS